MVYTSSTLALAALEYLVHLDLAVVPSDLMAITIEVPDTVPVTFLDPNALPATWAQFADCPACQAAGDAWLAKAQFALLRVPSAPIPDEANVLLNPQHPDAAHWRTVVERPFHFDPRLVR